MRRWLRRVALAVALLAAFMFLNNTNLWIESGGTPTVLAHRGLAQDFDRTDLKNDTCTAERMLPPTHGYLENTLESMRASFELGADIVEIDVHSTTDGQFAVFHDWTVDCRTEGTGVTRELSMAELKRLDIGYGYTADGGRTFPFRGKGVGLMPSLDEVLATFPERRLLINIKSDDVAEAESLAAALKDLPPERQRRLSVYGGNRAIERLGEILPDLATTSRRREERCLIAYFAYGWTGLVPSACGTMVVMVPINFAPWLWGWPNRFVERMRSVGSEVFVLGPYGGGFSVGLNTSEDLARLPADYGGGIWTDNLGLVVRTLGRQPAGQ